MKNPLRSEADAFQFLLGSVVYFALIVIAAVINRWAGLAVFIVLTAGVALVVVSVATSSSRPVRPPLLTEARRTSAGSSSSPTRRWGERRCGSRSNGAARAPAHECS